MPRWTRFWAKWIVLGILAELIALVRGTPLTGVMRRWVLAHAAGSVVVGAFLVWLPVHWLWIESGMGVADVVALVLGGAAGYAGHRRRVKKDEPPAA